MNDCKYGHDIKGSVMRLTLLKSATRPSPVADYGEHFMTYSIMPHKGGFRTGGTIEQAYSLNNPLHSVHVSGGVDILGNTMSFVNVDKPNVVIEAVKKAEDSDDVIVRVYECHNMRTDAILKFSNKIKHCEEVNLLEEKPEEVNYSGKMVKFSIKPYEIRTFKVRL
jgi:alpha-mannosidase